MATNGMTIDGLNTVSALTAQDKVPVWDNESSGEPTRKITAQNMANSVKSLASLPNTTEMNAAIAQSTATRTITLTSLTPVGSTDGFNRCVVSGNTGMISISAVITSASYEWQKVFNLSDSVGPKYDVYFALVDTNDMELIGCAYITTDGVYVKTTIGNKKVRGFCTWIIGQ